MALYQNITITDAGAELISGIILNGGSPLTFEAVAVGSGELADGTNTAAFTGLIKEEKRLPIETVTQQGGIITITARLATDTITADLYHREVGVYANGVLLAYGNTGDKYDFIPAAGKNAAVQKTIRIPLSIGTMQTAYADMDSSDLVSHAALSQRMKDYMPQLVDETLSDLLTQSGGKIEAQITIDQTYKKDSANAQSGKAVEEGINNAIYTSGEFRTTQGSTDYNGNAFEIQNPPSGNIQQIAVPCCSQYNAQIYTANSVFLSLFEKNANGVWQNIGISKNAITQNAGDTAVFAFDELCLSGKPLLLTIVTDRSQIGLNTNHVIGARVSSSQSKGFAYITEDLTVIRQYLIDVIFYGENVSPRYASKAHEENANLHVTEEEKANIQKLAEEPTAATGWAWIYAFPGASGDYLMTIGGANIYVPDSSGLETGEEVIAQYVETINRAQTHVTARAAATPSEIGSGGYFFILTATGKGATGNVKLSGNAAAVKFSGNSLTGGKDAVFSHIEDASCHVSEHDRAKWGTLNAYRLYANRDDITEIPSDTDLSNVIFAFEMAAYNKSLKSIAGLNMRSCLNAYGAFFNCPALETIDGANFVLCKDCYYMFAYDTSLRIIGSAGFDYAENTQEMFRKCAITSTGTSTFTYARNTKFMFAECRYLEDITSMGLMWIIEADGMFMGCILNKASVKHIANNINTVYKGRITIGINAELQGDSEVATALETIRGKGWTVTVEYNTKTA